jgi:hypothetical protein
MSTSPPVPILVTITPVTIPAVAIPVAISIVIPFAVPVLSAIERQEQCERIGRTSLLEKRLIIIQQLIVINEGRLCSFDEAHPPCTPGTYERSTTGFQNATWIKKPIM